MGSVLRGNKMLNNHIKSISNYAHGGGIYYAGNYIMEADVLPDNMVGGFLGENERNLVIVMSII